MINRILKYLSPVIFVILILTDNSFPAFKKPVSKGKVRITGRRIYVNNAPFFIKGVGYQPIPIDHKINYPVFWQKEIYERDLPLLRKMGCNTVRTWAVADNKEFLDACYNNGKDPIYVITGPWLNPQDFTNEDIRSRIKEEWRKFILEFKDHPAILMWQAGNEANYAFPPDSKRYLYGMINELAKLAYELEGENYHPFTTANGGTESIGDPKACADDESMCYLDAWGANMYPGKSFWNSHLDYMSKTEKPLWISEYGCDAYDTKNKREDQDAHAECVLGLFRELAGNSDVYIGGTIMAWADEWWKAGNISVQDEGGWKHPGFFDGVANEEWWGIVAVERQEGREDKVIPRKLYYELEKEWKKEIVFKEPKKDIRVDRIIHGKAISSDDIISVTASSQESGKTSAGYSVDGKTSTRWSSKHGVDPSWLIIELKKPEKITGIYINWEFASAKRYKVEISEDGESWQEAVSVNDGEKSEERIIYFSPLTGKYVRLFCEERASEWGYSVWEIKLNPGSMGE